MKAQQRAAIAGIASAIHSNRNIKNVYSYELSTYICLSGSVTPQRVNIYDYSRSCYISGNAKANNEYSLFDYGTSGYITLKVSSSKLTGYDYGSGSYFSGTIKSHGITIYDYETGAYYDFSC